MIQRMVGVKAPDFKMKTALGDGISFGEVKLEDYKGKWLVMFFYPLDFTFVCPTEITSMNNKFKNFKELNAEILAVSTDSIHSHKAWINASKEMGGLGKLNFPIGSDNTHIVSKDYGIYIEEEGVALRGLFIIDPKGILRYSVVHDLGIGRSADETLRVLQALQAGGLCPADWNPGDELL